MISKYTVREFRKSVKEAFDSIDKGGQVFISRHGTRYELRIADVQSGKKQFEEPKATPVSFPDNGDARAQVESADDFGDIFAATPTKIPGGDTIELKKNIVEGKPSEKVMNEPVEFAPDTPIKETDTPRLRGMLIQKRGELNRIDIDTQDPDEVERGTQLAADVAAIESELRSRGL